MRNELTHVGCYGSWDRHLTPALSAVEAERETHPVSDGWGAEVSGNGVP